MNRFLDAIETDCSIDPKSLKINSSVGEIAERIARAYDLIRIARDVIVIRRPGSG